MACGCINDLGVRLKEHNTRLGITLTFGEAPNEFPTLVVEQIERGRGKPKAVCVLPTFCPFCGNRYRAEDATDA